MSRRSRRNVRFFALLMAAAAWRVYDRRLRGRVPSQEGIEEAAVSQAFNRIARLPQMVWARQYVTTRALALQDHGEAVDLGCGPGYLVQEMAQRAPNLHVTGVDLSTEMLKDAQAYAREAGMEGRVDFRLGDAQSIPFADESLDLVVSTLSLHHWSSPPAVLSEIQRVLKPGGAFMIFDLRRDLAAPFYLIFWAATQFIVPAALHHINEPMGSRNAAYTAEELAELAQRSALRGWQVTAGPLWVILEGRKPAA